MTFLYPLYFLLLIPIILFLILLYFKWWKKILFWDISVLEKVFKKNTYYIKIYYFIIFIIFVLFASILARPVSQNVLEKNNKNWIDIQIVLDVSYSMIAEDLKPNRLEVAKDVISWFLNKIQTDRVWIIVFAWKTFTSLPLNFDYNIIQKIVSKITINTINQTSNSSMQWTATWDALVKASDSFWNDNKREKVIILLTDWESNRWLEPLLAIEYIKKSYSENIKIYTIWIWWNKETTIKIKNQFLWYQEMKVWAVDEETLKMIAKKTNWKYFRATNKNTLENIFDTISKLEKKEIELEKIEINNEEYRYFLYNLILFFILFLGIKRWKRL